MDRVLGSSKLTSPVVLKIDAQGAEVHVLKGAEGLYSKIDVIIIEYWPYGLLRLGSKPEDFFEVIKQYPYGLIYEEEENEMPSPLPIVDLIKELKKFPADGTEAFHLDILLLGSRDSLTPSP